MTILLGLIVGLVGLFCVMWSVNTSFAAHLQEDRRKLWQLHGGSFLLLVVGATMFLLAGKLIGLV